MWRRWCAHLPAASFEAPLVLEPAAPTPAPPIYVTQPDLPPLQFAER
jgi:hypothetical protein